MLLFKISRHSDSLKSFGQTLMNSYKELMSLFVYLTIGVIFFSIIVFYCEKDKNPLFVSGPASFWWGKLNFFYIVIFKRLNFSLNLL